MRRDGKEAEQSGGKKCAVDRIFFFRVEGVDLYEAGELVSSG
jgi:hypothetical protein